MKMSAEKRPNPRVVMIGAYPPPFGGVSVHVKRLAHYLNKNYVDCAIIDINAKREPPENVFYIRSLQSLRAILCSRRSIIHVHFSDISLKKSIFVFLMSILYRVQGNRLIITFHRRFEDVSRLRLQAGMMCMVTRFIAVSSDIRDCLLLSHIKPERISVIPAFISPEPNDDDIDKITNRIWSFMNAHNPVISAYAHGAVLEKGIDIYGIDMCFNLCEDLLSLYPRLGMIIALQNTPNKDFLDGIRRRISEKGISENLLLMENEEVEFYPILMRSTVYVRPTTTDGDAVAIREALHFNTPAVASDAAKRPDATVLFINRDRRSFANSVVGVLRNLEANKRRLDSFEERDYGSEVFRVYKDLVEFT